MECYRELVSIKRVHVAAWQSATCRNMLDVYVHHNIEAVTLDSALSVSTVKRQIPKKSKIMGQASKMCRHASAGTTTKFVKPMQTRSAAVLPVSQTMFETASTMKQVEMREVQTQEVKSAACLNKTNAPVTGRLNLCEVKRSKQGLNRAMARDSSQGTTTEKCPSVSLNDTILKRHKHVLNLKECHVPRHEPNIKENTCLDPISNKFEKSLNLCNTEARQTSAVHTVDSYHDANERKGKRLSGAARRRLKHLKQSLTAEVASKSTKSEPDLINASHIPSQKPMRARNKNSKLEQESSKLQKFSGLPIPLGICNIQPMSLKEINMVCNAILNKIMKEKSGAGPRFLKAVNKPGCLLLFCADHYSQQWVVRMVPKLKPWPEAKLSTMLESELPKPILATIFVPSAVTCSAIKLLERLKLQNRGLNTECWKVHYESHVTGGRLFRLSLDQSSALTLKESKCKASLGAMKMIRVRIKGGGNNVC